MVFLVKLKKYCAQTRNKCFFKMRFRMGVMPIKIFVCSLAHALSIFLLHFPSRGCRCCGTTVLISTLGFGSLWPKFFIHVCTRVMQSSSIRRLSSGKTHRSDEAGCSNLGWVKLTLAFFFAKKCIMFLSGGSGKQKVWHDSSIEVSTEKHYEHRSWVGNS